jgi:hypothetical protein
VPLDNFKILLGLPASTVIDGLCLLCPSCAPIVLFRSHRRTTGPLGRYYSRGSNSRWHRSEGHGKGFKCAVLCNEPRRGYPRCKGTLGAAFPFPFLASLDSKAFRQGRLSALPARPKPRLRRDEAPLWRQAIERSEDHNLCHSDNCFSTKQALCPPRPKELLSAVLTSAFRGWLGT